MHSLDQVERKQVEEEKREGEELPQGETERKLEKDPWVANSCQLCCEGKDQACPSPAASL